MIESESILMNARRHGPSRVLQNVIRCRQYNNDNNDINDVFVYVVNNNIISEVPGSGGDRRLEVALFANNN